MDARLKKYSLKGYNLPKKTLYHKTKSHIVLAKKGNQIKLIRFGQQGVSGDKTMTERKKSFLKRHKKNILKGILYPAYWSKKVKWS
tara:strand:+ start:1381 stop:1638 length:258 start_codon:yes stop_codon:yes gene_type:complete